MNSDKINSFTDLHVWQEGHILVVSIYKITKLFPREELYSLVDQMRRAASSVTANIAEGFRRNSYTDKLHFYYQANGSLLEVKNFLLIANDVGYLDEKQTEELINQLDKTHKLLQGFILKTKTFIPKS